MSERAYYRLEVGVVKRSNGHSSVAKAAYHAGEKIRDERLGEMFDFSRKSDVYAAEILAPTNAPTWMREREQLWNAVEVGEKRKDARTARHFVLSLPNFMSHEEKIAVTKDFLHQECVQRGMVADVAWHDFTGKNQYNPHAHVLLSMRNLDGDGFGHKNRDWDKKELLQNWREKWAEHLNLHLAKGGYQARVDHRSYADQGIDREPMAHEGAAHSALRREGLLTHLNAHNDNVRQRNHQKEQIAQLEAELVALRTQQAAQRRPAPPTQTPARPSQQVTAAVMQSYPSVQPPSAPIPTAIPTSTPKRPKDPTEYAVRRQLQAMGGNGVFEIGILDPDTGKMVNKTWHQAAILRYDEQEQRYPLIAYLKQQNSAGKHIYVRLAPLAGGDSQGLILVDDLDRIQVEELKEKGLTAACVVETSYRNHQAWVKFDRPLGRDQTTALAKILAAECGGDPASAAWQHYGRLAGFTNRKEQYSDKYTGKYPWVRITEATGRQAEAAVPYLERMAARVRQATTRQQDQAQQRSEWLEARADDAECQRALKSFGRIRNSANRRYQQDDDSRLDWVTLKRLAKRGYSLSALEYALTHGSPDLDTRKQGHAADYIRRTIDNISRDPDVLETLDRRTRKSAADERERIEQWQQFKDRERDSPASSTSTPQVQIKQPSGDRIKPHHTPLGSGKSEQTIVKPADVTITPLGDLNAEQVAWLVTKTLDSKESQAQFRKAGWALTQDTSKWQQVKAEYLKELARTVEVKGAQAYHPYTDAEIGIKLRMAGFGKQRIYDCLKENSPFAAYLDEEAKTRYLYRGIAPVMDNPKINQRIAEWNQFRTREAITMPEAEREVYLKERRLDKLNLSLTPERWEQQRVQSTPSSRTFAREQERER